MDEEKSQGQKFVVRDRRRFDSSGEERSEEDITRPTNISFEKEAPEVSAKGSSGDRASSTSTDRTRESRMGGAQTPPNRIPESPSRGAQSGRSGGQGNGFVRDAAVPRAEASSAGVQGEFALGEGEESSNPEINFSSFVISLATQALMQLGEIQPPPGVNVPLDRESARHTIDILALLQQKTHGNLSQEEAQLLEEVLHNLRLSYVRVAKK